MTLSGMTHSDLTHNVVAYSDLAHHGVAHSGMESGVIARSDMSGPRLINRFPSENLLKYSQKWSFLMPFIY